MLKFEQGVLFSCSNKFDSNLTNKTECGKIEYWSYTLKFEKNMSKRIISAIDVGSSKICAVIASVEEDNVPSVIGVAIQQSQGIKKGVVVNIDEAINSIASTLEAAERMAGITVPSIFLSVSGKHITSTNNRGVVAVSTEEIVPDDVFRAIESARTVSIPAGREILHVIPREFIVDSQGGVKDPVGHDRD